MNDTNSDSISPLVATNSNAALDDIEYLMRLEAWKRCCEDDKNIRRQVNERTHQLQEAKQEYLNLYDKYATLLKHIGTLGVVQSKPKSKDSLIATAAQQIDAIMEKTTSGCSTAYLDREQLDMCKIKLNEHKERPELSKEQVEVAKKCETLRGIQTAVENVETTLEAVCSQGMNQLVSLIQDDNLPSE